MKTYDLDTGYIMIRVFREGNTIRVVQNEDGEAQDPIMEIHGISAEIPDDVLIPFVQKMVQEVLDFIVDPMV